MKLTKIEHNRTFFVFLLISVWILAILSRLVNIQVFNFSKYLSKVRQQSKRVLTLIPNRGTIYDCRGEILAISVKAQSAFLSNKNAADSSRILNEVARKISFDYQDKQNIRSRIFKGDKFIWVKRQLTEGEYASIKNIKGPDSEGSLLSFIEEYRRIYPQKSTASHILGGVGIDAQGLFGVEFSMDSLLLGKGGKVDVELDARRRIFNYNYIKNPIPGKDVYLTIDSSIQFFVEKELQKVVEQYRAKGGTVIVMNSQDSSILALASYPFYQPDQVQFAPKYALKNRAISFLYDPGSTFKIVMAATALENDVCYPQQVFYCFNGTYQLKNHVIIDVHPYNSLTFEDIVVHSSNIGAARIGQMLGQNRLYKGIKLFGYGQRTGIELPAEERGILNHPKHWSQFTSAYIAFGYEISVTPLQMLRAYNVLASGGYLQSPTLIRSVAGKEPLPHSRRQVLSKPTLRRLNSILTKVVSVGTGQRARIEGIEIAGKTGTAKKIINGRYTQVYVSSFAGFFPAQNPKITMFVVIDEPQGIYYGGDVAAPLFKTIAEKLLIYLNIFPELDQNNEIKI